ncbi:MAG TPA: hypothetical protein VMF87_21075 [Streptosporangiaceae bacterium]|nr:hypothetical protein [Streptosporangiaceae bacterium]
MDFAHDAEDPADVGSDVADGGEDLADDGPDVADRDLADGDLADGDLVGDGEAAGPREATGEPRVDAALARLDELAGRPVTEHRAVFEDVHRRLRDVLGELDSRQQPQSRDATDAAGRPGH